MPDEMAQDATASTESTETQEETSESYEDSGQGETQDQHSNNQETQGDEYTDKGTRLDPNPASRVNQELANERKKNKDYEEILNNPQLLKAYVSQFDKEGKQEPVEEAEDQQMSIDQVETTQDLQKFLKQQDGQVQKKLKELDSTISGVKASQKDEAVASNIKNDITAVRESYPELDPKSNQYNPELDRVVGNLFDKADFDAKAKRYRGSISLKEIADDVVSASRASKKQGSQDAQTTIRDRRSGRADGGGKSSNTPDESNMSPAQLIAQRVKAAKGSR